MIALRTQFLSMWFRLVVAVVQALEKRWRFFVFTSDFYQRKARNDLRSVVAPPPSRYIRHAAKSFPFQPKFKPHSLFINCTFSLRCSAPHSTSRNSRWTHNSLFSRFRLLLLSIFTIIVNALDFACRDTEQRNSFFRPRRAIGVCLATFKLQPWSHYQRR